MSIDEFIDKVAPKLNEPLKSQDTFVLGKDLKLTGFGKSDKPIDNDAVYKIKVPIKPEQRSDHRMKLRLAWLRGGKPAIRTYLLKYMNPEDVEKAISVI